MMRVIDAVIHFIVLYIASTSMRPMSMLASSRALCWNTV